MSDLSPAVLAALGEVTEAPAAEAPEAPVAVEETQNDATPPEAPAEAPKAPVAPANDVQERAAKERSFRQAEQAAREASAQAKRELAELAAAKKEVEDARRLAKLAKEDPLAWLQETGHDFAKMGTDLAMGKRPGPADKALEELAVLRKQVTDMQEAAAKRETEQLYASVKQEATEYVRAKTDEYELINKAGLYDVVMEQAQRHYEETGEIDVDGAAAKVEKYLESIINLVKDSNKFKQRVPSEATESGTTATKTLTHKTQVPVRSKPIETEEDRFNAAVALL